jgi:anaerobic magnesium-protoporphyrin IX monomethyl ester cyclase
MNVLLIDPPYDRIIGQKSEWYPLGLVSIATYIKSKGFPDVKVYHAEHDNSNTYKSVVKYSEDLLLYKKTLENDNHIIWQEIRNVIATFCPDVLGISILSAKRDSALKIAKICKEIDKNIVIVAGNHHATTNPEDILKDVYVDFVVRGEGEETFYELLRELKSKRRDFKHIKGLSFSDSSNIIHNEDRELIKNLDDIPNPDRKLIMGIENYSSSQLEMVMTSRGCPYSCAFCGSINMWHKKVRWRSLDSVFAEIEELQNESGVRNITFMDDSFTINKKRVHEFCTQMLERKIDISWSCLTRVDHIDDGTIKIMKRAGCTKVSLGIESGNERILQVMDKKIDLKRIKEAVSILRKNQMYWSAFFMFGLPSETKEEMIDTLNFMKEIKPDWSCVSIFTPYPGTKMYDQAIDLGVIKEMPDYSLYTHQSSHIPFSGKISEEEGRIVAKFILEEFHKYNSSYWLLIKRALTRNYLKNPRLLLTDLKKVITWIK